MALWCRAIGRLHKPSFNRTSLSSQPISSRASTYSSPCSMSTSDTNGYIVVFNDDVTKDEITKYVDDINKNGGNVKVRYDEGGGILNGFAAAIPDGYLESFRSSYTGVIKYIEPDQTVSIQ
ncbi:hypothetical protein B0H34DRAFT_705258 [Crassisporium funariophilum]|nr:hypothetical protein B0H34DRAFT_705258 [Crassisporium funariophilum]